MPKCCFCGHRRPWEVDYSITADLTAYIEKLITVYQVDTFYSGGMGVFDRMCERIVRSLKKKYPYIKLYLVVPYLSSFLNTQKMYLDQGYDEIIYPDLNGVFYKAAIQKRNRWMIQNSDYLVAYVCNSTGGARQSYCYAKTQNIIIKNFA